MRQYYLLINIFILLVYVTSCNGDTIKNPDRKPTLKEQAKKKRASFDKLPNHNDSIVGCWIIDKSKSVQVSTMLDIDALFFLEEHKKFNVYDSAKYSEFEEHIGFFRFYNNELTLENSSDKSHFQSKWTTIITKNEIIAQNKKYPNKFLYLSKINKKSGL